MSEALRKAELAREASRVISRVPAAVRSRAIEAAAGLIEARAEAICAANAAD
ncbi:MAG TPA: gamma-glutamyl-phosphate reductase, partial [Olsenella sp.]|nr:gamma-glutamyl-phosphate reductase [Olsenella sp.]